MATYDPNIFTPNPQDVYPQQAVDGQEWSRTEALLTPDLFVQRFLRGVPLVSRLKNPLTGKPDVWTPAILQDAILRAVAQVEIQTGVEVFPVQHDEPIPFDRVNFETYGYFRLKHRPVLSIDQLSIRPANNVQGSLVWPVPKEWISFQNADKGQINIVPLVAANTQVFYQAQTTNGAAFIMTFLTAIPFVPSFWQCLYTTGFAEGNIPKVLNELVGCTAAIEILGEIAATNIYSSYSMGIDGMSQGQSGDGPRVFETRIKQLEDRRRMLEQKFKAIYGVKLAMGNI